MATWITHLMIADEVLKIFPQLDRRGFCVGNIAPDCNVENEDWSAFTPSRAVTHWMQGERKSAADCDAFYDEYITKRRDQIDSEEEYAFLLGYYAHLITDAAFQKMIRDENRVKAVWRRIMADDCLHIAGTGMEPTWDNAKKLIPKRIWTGQIYSMEAEYLNAHPDSGYLTEVLPLKAFPDYIDYLPEGAIVRKIGVMGYLPKVDPNCGDWIAISREEYEDYIRESIRLVTEGFRKYGLMSTIYGSIVSRTPIRKGWSGDQKYCVVTSHGSKYLLRISSIDRLEHKRREYDKMREVAQLGIPMCLPVEFGICDDGVYCIQSWIDGEDAEEKIMTMDHEEQYRYGLDAGRILAKIHTIPAPSDVPDWERRFNAKIDRKIAMYESCPLKYDRGGDILLDYLTRNRHLLHNRPQTWQHGDYHIGNMMIDRTGKLIIIDFEKHDIGDPWEEFNRIVWSAQTAPAFASGMVDGYFKGNVPMEFWKLLALYISSNTLGSLPWSIPFGESEIQVMQKQAAQVLRWYDVMKNVVPAWYQEK